jgi:hypothetical protein
MSGTRWHTCKSLGIPCAVCGKLASCTISPDRTAFKCWREGGRVHQMRSQATCNDYFGTRPDPKPGNNHNTSVFMSPEKALSAARGTIKGVAKLSHVWTYTKDGREIMRVARFDLRDGSKQFRPINQKGANVWRIGDPAGPLPLYHVDDLAGDGVIFVCEGEKATEAARKIGLLATTSAHGSAAADKSDWTPLAGRDAPGAKYAQDVTRLLLKLSPPARVKIVELPGLPDGGDIVEYIEAGGTSEQIKSLVAAAKEVEASDVLGGPVTRKLSTVKREPVRWFWRGKIPRGKVTVVAGDGGLGKSFVTIDLGARATTNRPGPDRAELAAGSIVMVNLEDDAADTIGPRFDAAGGDSSKVVIFDVIRRIGENGKPIERTFTLADIDDLRKAIDRAGDCVAAFVDPVGAVMGTADSYKESDVRALMAPLAKLAAERNVAIVLVMHVNRRVGAPASARLMGSAGFGNAARSVWFVVKDPDNPERRLLLPAKSNIGRDRTGLAFTIVPARPDSGPDDPAVVAWEDSPVTTPIDEAMAGDVRSNDDDRPGPPARARDAAADWLRDLLADGPMRVGNPKDPEPGSVAHAAKGAGLSWNGAVRRAREALGIKPYKGQFGDGWYWKLPETTCASSEEPAHLRVSEPPEGVPQPFLPDNGVGSAHLPNDASNGNGLHHTTAEGAQDAPRGRERGVVW